MTSFATCLRAAVLLVTLVRPAWAAGPDDAKGLWMGAEKDAVLEFKPCADAPTALCGHIVWDKDAGQATDTCGVPIARLERYENEAWRDGWVYDPRDGKKYKGALRVKAGELQIRAFLGTEILGQTERLQRVAALPVSPVCKP
ncbi:DUF2147 domain-containing protein [Variovorax ginsengisoli]|uniref:Uncharacterized protein (DUF2147 family) n=1 Tax=Variovorax ginsengisoli TaxID=363844 RepID=A0ABT9S920_9BURK|nr:DUF2147 domain-containing protein [Variovorax ginsengisoli]MDP9900850.1 uncharacterized protein (DUF2147 family) [Variovorax ginsengisoli]